MMTGMSVALQTKEATVEKYAVVLRSHLHRSAARSIARSEAVKALDLTNSRTVRLPRRDDEIAKAWILRAVRRMSMCPVADPKWDYEADVTGSGARQFASVRVLIPTTAWEWELFDGLRFEGHVLRYIDQDSIPPLTAVFETNGPPVARPFTPPA